MPLPIDREEGKRLFKKYRSRQDGIRNCPEMASVCLICESIDIAAKPDADGMVYCRNCGFAFYRYSCPASGETKNILIPAAEAYGPRLDENIIKVKRDMFPADRELRIGEKLRIEFNGGRERILIILEANEQEVTLDGNHPLAGCDLTFALRLDAVE